MSNAPLSPSRREGRSPVLAIGLLLLLYFVIRIPSLGVLPIFLDEAVHIQWAERLYGEGRILRPVGAGRLLAVAAYGLSLPFEDRLWVSRLIATLAGATTLVFTLLLSRRLFGERAGVIAGGLYVLSPFALTYDRLALSDGFLAASMAGVMFATHALVDPHGRSPAGKFGLAALVALAIISKVSAPLFLLTIPLCVFSLARSRKASFGAVAPALGAGLLCALPMLWFFAANSGEITAQHVVDPALAGSVLMATLKDMWGWVFGYFTAPALVAAVLSLIFLRDRRALWLGGSVALPLLLFAGLSQPWSARYILPTLPPLLILIAGGVERVATMFRPDMSTLVAVVVTLLVSIQGLCFDRYLLLDPAAAPFPADDRHQLVTGWPAGYGVREVASLLKREAARGPIRAFIDTGGTRTMPTSLAILLGKGSGVSLIEGDLGVLQVREKVRLESRTAAVFAVIGPRSPTLDFRALMDGLDVERLGIFQRPGGEWAGTVFRVGLGSAPGR